MLEIRLLENGEQRFSELVVLIEEAVECWRRVAGFGAYAVIGTYNSNDVKINIVASLSQNTLNVQSPLFTVIPLSLRHLVAAIRYQSLKKGLLISLRVKNSDLISLVEVSVSIQLDANFSIDVTQWCCKRPSIEIIFNCDIEPALADRIDERVSAWALFSRMGAYCSAEQFSVVDEDVDVGVFLDLPTVGCDWIEWSTTRIEVPEEAIPVLINQLILLDHGSSRILSLWMG